jgi:PAS domain S-box-containing protein
MSEKILVVDDDERLLRAFARNLELMGYTVFPALTGEQALEIHEQESPDIALVDVRMPHMTGLSVLQAIRARDLRAEVILVTGHGDMDMAVEALRAGASDFVQKPIELGALDNVLRYAKERLALKQDLRASEERYRVLIESAPDAIVITDSDGYITLVNAQTEAMFGYRREELLGQYVELLVPERLQKMHTRHRSEYYTRLRTRPMGIGLELIGRRQDGSEFPVEISLSPVQTGGEMLVTSVIRDVTERQQIEERLRLQGSALESAANAIAITDRRGHITWINPAFTRLTGYAPEEALGQNPRVLKSGQHEPAFYENMWKTILAGRVWHDEIVNRRQDGSLYTEEMTITPVEDARGEISHFIAIKRDITKRKQAEAALAREAAINAAIADLSKALISTASLDDIAYIVLEHAKRLTGSAFGFVGYVDPQTGYLVSATLSRDIWNVCQVPDKSAVFEKLGGLWGWVLDNRSPLLTNDPASDPRSTGVPQGHIPIQRFLSAPALIEDTLVGQVALANPGRDYTERDLDVVERLATLYALAVQRKRAEQELRQYADQQAALYAVTSAVTSFLDPDELLPSALDVVLSVVHADAGWVVLPGSEPDDRPRVAASHGISASFVADLEASSLGICTLCTSLFAEGARPHRPIPIAECPLLSADVLAETDLHDHAGVPLITGNRTLGILNIAWRQSHAYSEEACELLAAIGRQVGLALRNAQLYQAARQVDRLEALNAIGAAAVSSLDRDVLLRRILELTCEAVDAVEGSILIRDPETEDLVFMLSVDEDSLALQGRRVASGQGIAGWVAQHGQPACVNDVHGDERFYAEIDALTGRETRSLLCAPLIHRGETTGVIELVNKRQSEFSDEDLSLLEAVSSIAAAAIDNARLHMTALMRADELSSLNEIGRALTSTLERQEVVHNALTVLQRLFQADGAALLQVASQARGRGFAQVQLGAVSVEIPERLPLEECLGDWSPDNRQPVLIEEPQSDPWWTAPLGQCIDRYLDEEPGSVMVAPLNAPGQVVGVIVVISAEKGVFTSSNLYTLQSIASTVTIALENARLYDELKVLLREREEAQAQLLRTEKLSALGRLAASLAHEINNPLQSVIGCLGLAQEGMAEGGDVSQFLEVALREVRRVARTVGQMRDLYRPASEERVPTEVNALIEQVLELSRKRCQEVGVDVVWEPATGLPLLDLASDQIQQVFLNLVLNALEAMPQGGRLEVTTVPTEQPTGVRADVRDSGQGISPDVLPRIFEPFFSTKSEGTGLGLSTSHDIIERHGGYIEVDSEVGKGSTFTVWLPT